MLNRRQLLQAGCAATFTPLKCQHTHAATEPVQIYRLWPSSWPHKRILSRTPHVSASGAWSSIRDPLLHILQPPAPNGSVVLIAAGGGYQRIEITHEAIPAARWLTSLGITACILFYRLPNEGWPYHANVPFADAQRAVHLIRTNTLGLNVPPKRVGALGFSAGGHLLGMHALRPTFPWAPELFPSSRLSSQLDMAMLLYPVISFERPYRATRARTSLIGQHPTDGERAQWSLTSYCHSGAPPLFIAQAEDDPIIGSSQTARFETLCHFHHIPIERHLFPTGGHGFALGCPATTTQHWPSLAEAWMKRQAFI